MIYKKLGNIDIPAIGQGAALNSNVKSLRLGIELGMSFIDTAEGYGDGHSEQIVAQAIEGVRDKVFIATKVSSRNLAYNDVLNSAEGSLSRLKIDHIDLYQIHWSNPAIPLSETIRAMEQLVKQGKVRLIGVSNFSLRELKQVREAAPRERIVSNQIEYNLFDRSIENDILPYCQREGITIIAHTPLDHWQIASWGGKVTELYPIAHKYGKTIGQIMLNWLTTHASVIAIPKASKIKHIRENATATDFKLSVDDFGKIDRIFTPEYVYVSPERIQVAASGRKYYRTVEEAISNRFEASPSPWDLAQSIKQGEVLKAVRLMPASHKGKYDYDLVEGAMRYWAHVIANENAPIKALIRRI